MSRLFLILIALILSCSAFAQITYTNQPFDMMIIGDAKFAVINKDSSLSYTEDGRFTVNVEGQVVDKYNRPLYPGFAIPEKTWSIDIQENGSFTYYAGKTRATAKPQYVNKIILFVEEDGKMIPEEAMTPPYNLIVMQGQLYVKKDCTCK